MTSAPPMLINDRIAEAEERAPQITLALLTSIGIPPLDPSG
jgi:hypothetical protein